MGNSTTRAKLLLDARDFVGEILTDQQYRDNLLKRAREGNLGALEAKLYEYYWGKPVQPVNISASQDLYDMPLDELQETLKRLSSELDTLKDDVEQPAAEDDAATESNPDPSIH